MPGIEPEPQRRSPRKLRRPYGSGYEARLSIILPTVKWWPQNMEIGKPPWIGRFAQKDRLPGRKEIEIRQYAICRLPGSFQITP